MFQLCLGILDSPTPRLRVCLLGNGRWLKRISRYIDSRHRLLIADAHPLCLQHRMILPQQRVANSVFRAQYVLTLLWHAPQS